MLAAADTYVVVGNPGVGKSTILNCLLGAAKFRSGLSAGSGMTYRLDKYTTEAGVTYADTPGLADTEKRQQAAAAITEALRLGGRFRVFFVVTLRQGRTSPEDSATLKIVLDAAPITSYGIIINQLSKEAYEALEGKPEVYSKVQQSVLQGLTQEQKTGARFCLMLRDSDLDSKPDVVKPLPQAVASFIAAAPPVVLEPRAVRAVDHRSLAEAAARAEQRRLAAAERERARREEEVRIARERKAAEDRRLWEAELRLREQRRQQEEAERRRIADWERQQAELARQERERQRLEQERRRQEEELERLRRQEERLDRERRQREEEAWQEAAARFERDFELAHEQRKRERELLERQWEEQRRREQECCLL